MPHRRVVGLHAGRLEPEPQSGQRRPQLVRRVADELALRLERLAEPLGHLVEGDRDLLLLAGAGHLGAGVELTVLDAARGSRERAQRPRERAGEHPGETEPERERREPDADDHEHVAPHALGDGRVALRHPHGADRPALVEDRHSRVEQLLADGLALPRSLLRRPCERGRDLGPVGVRLVAEPGAGRVGEQPAAAADDDHARAEVPSGLLDDALELRGVAEPRRRSRRHDLRLRRRLRAHLAVDPAREAEHERDLERDEDEHEHVRERREQLQAEAHATSSGEAKRKPTPRTVWM